MNRYRSSSKELSALAAGFTLVELMISIALVLLLMLGINRVFQVTGEAIGTNAAVSTGVRDARAAQAVFAGDFVAYAADSPALIIRSERVSAFRNRQDALGDKDWDGTTATELGKRTIDLDGDGTEGNSLGESTPAGIYNHRSHRVDHLSFFARGLFRRQTGGGIDASNNELNDYISSMTGTEAWISYGHIRRPDERKPMAGNQQFEHRDPGEDPNPGGGDFNDRNYFASDWVLGRMAMLLIEPVDTNGDGIGDTIRDPRDQRDPAGVRQRFIMRRDLLTDDTTVSPLALGIESSHTTAPRWEIQWSRYDLAGTSIDQFRTIVANHAANPVNTIKWYDRMSNWRFQGDPTPIKPINPDNVARTTPVFLANCPQFIVEFAGDFVEQTLTGGTAGQVTDVDGDGNVFEPDGQVDFIVVSPGTANESRRIRWYGMPRDVSGPNGAPDGIIFSSIAASGQTNNLVDVVPLLDVLETGGFALPAGAAFIERRLPRTPAVEPFGSPPARYADITTGGGMAATAQYVAAWGPDNPDQPRPQMIRIVFAIDDPTGRIAEGQTYEYVYRLGG